KRCPLFVIEHLKKEGIVEKLKIENKPIRVNLLEDANFYQRIAISIKYHNQLFGYLWIYEPEAIFTDEQMELTTRIAARIGELLFNNQLAEKHDVHTLLWKMVNGEFTNNMEMYRAAKLANYSLPKQFSIVILSVQNPKYLYVFKQVKKIFVDMRIVYYLGKGTEIIGLIDTDDHDGLNAKVQKFFEQINKDLAAEERDALFIGIGNEYETLKRIRKSYLEALEVIETMSFLNVRNQKVYFYYELGFYRHLKAMYKKNVTEQYRNEQIVTLIDKDIKANSELVKTVWYYLKNDSKAGQTADELFIHHNTLHYRLKQVNELTSIDFTNVVEKMELYLELFLIFHVADYEEHYKKAL